MGWDSTLIIINGRVSRHNSRQDAKDDALMEEYVERIKAIAREHRYESIQLEVSSDYAADWRSR